MCPCATRIKENKKISRARRKLEKKKREKKTMTWHKNNQRQKADDYLRIKVMKTFDFRATQIKSFHCGMEGWSIVNSRVR